MMDSNWRIFLAYRGDTIGKEFVQDLYDVILQDPAHEIIYGKVFLSEESTGPGHNFKKDVPEIMKNVEYFVMPLTKGCFDDCMIDGEINDDSIIYHEIKAAISVEARFICIEFPGFELDVSMLKTLFGERYDFLSCSTKQKYEEENKNVLINTICETILKIDIDADNRIIEKIDQLEDNVHISTKRKLEDSLAFPLFQRLYGAKRITLMNFAASSFISGNDIASSYQETDYLKRSFFHNLREGRIEADIILTAPYGSAAQDASLYKMFPEGQIVDSEKIILHNLNRLISFKKSCPAAKLNVYLTQIALPYGIMMIENRQREKNYIKVDLYAPVSGDDGQRPSFYLLAKKAETEWLYSFFESNVRKIKQYHAFRFDGQSDLSPFLGRKSIIHRGIIDSGTLPHTRRAYDMCLEAKHPIEVDLLQMQDGSIIVGRDDFALRTIGYDSDQMLSSLRIHQLKEINRSTTRENHILTLEEFLDHINGRIPVLFEIKIKGLSESNQAYIEKVVQSLQQYAKRCSGRISDKQNRIGVGFALHSSDPRVMSRIKKMDCMIPCGVITRNYDSLGDEVGDAFYKLHKNKEFTDDYFKPDFISCDVHYLAESKIIEYCDKQQIPLLVWTIRNKEEHQLAIDYQCSNVIIEGGKSYL